MKRIFLLLLLVSFSVPIFAAQKRAALVIGNSQYKHLNPLKNPGNDSQAVAAKLKEMGFTLIGRTGKPTSGAVQNLDEDGFIKAYLDFAKAAEGADIALVYYAGHGMQIGGRSYLLPTDVPKDRVRLIQRNAIELDSVLEELDGKAKLTVAIFDACREIPELDKAIQTVTRSSGLGASEFRGLARVQSQGRSRLVAFAGAAGQLVKDGKGVHSPYTSLLLDELNKNASRPVEDVFQQIAYGFGQRYGGQNPEVLIQGVRPGYFYFVPPPPGALPPLTPRVAPARLDPEILFWQSCVQSGNAACFRAYLEQYPNGHFKTAARANLYSSPTPPAQQTPAENEGKLGLNRAERTRIQQALNVLGHDVGATDGIWGKGTRAGIKAWQRAVGRAVTGYLDAEGYRQLLAKAEPLLEQERARKQALAAQARTQGQDQTKTKSEPTKPNAPALNQIQAKVLSIAVVPFAGEDGSKVAAILAADLLRSGRFRTLPEADMLTLPHSGAEVDFRDWRELGQDVLVVGKVEPNGSENLILQYQLFDVVQGTQLAGYSVPTTQSALRGTVHKIADVIYEKLTGIPGAFYSRIAYVEEQADNAYKLKVADSDGHNQVTIVASDKPFSSPRWSPDGRRIVYVSMEQGRQSIYVQEVLTGRRERVAAYDGANADPAWSPNGRSLAMTLSKDGNRDIYTLDLESKRLSQITKHWSTDMEPTWSPDGGSIVFTSDRGGLPQLYITKISSGEMQRLTFQNSRNDQASFSPDGENLAFVTHENGNDRIALLELATGLMTTLTKGKTDAAPVFSPNGQMILYSTSEGGRQSLGLVSINGRIRQRMGAKDANVSQPAWMPR